MEEHPEIEFEMFLAVQLGTTVGRMRREMANSEFARWGIYFARKAQREELARLQRGG
jgi:hypothetical protein